MRPDAHDFLPGLGGRCSRNLGWLGTLADGSTVCGRGPLDSVHGAAPSATPGRVTIDVPSVPYPGSRTDAYFFRTAAWNLRNGYDLGGSNLRDTVAVLLDRVATGLDGAPPKPGGRLS